MISFNFKILCEAKYGSVANYCEKFGVSKSNFYRAFVNNEDKTMPNLAQILVVIDTLDCTFDELINTKKGFKLKEFVDNLD